MSAIVQKLNYKDQGAVWLLSAPESFRGVMDDLGTVAEVHENLAKAKAVTFALAFATRKSEVDTFASQIAKAAPGDAVIWVASPKGTSKRYQYEFNRDNGWNRFGALGIEPVRMVAIDEDWSALRFRRVEYCNGSR